MDHDQIAASLRLALDREAARHEISPGAWSQIERGLRRRAWRRGGIVAACVAIVAAAAVTPYLWHAISGPAVSRPRPRPAPQLVIVSRTHLRAGVTRFATGYGAVWVVGLGVIYRVDPATAKTVATIPAPGAGEWSGIATGGGAVWVTEPKQGPGIVIRIDPRTNRVSGPPIRVGTGAAQGVAGFGALWVTNGNGNGSVSRINPATGVVTRTLVNIPDVDAVGAGSLWGTSNYGGIQRVDPATGRVTATIRLPNAVRVIFWAGSAWASNDQTGTVVRIDPASNRIVGKAAPAGTSPIYIAPGPSGL